MGVTAIVGAQWGSEGKGVVAAALAHKFDVAIRVGGPNAGHSFNRNGRVFKMRGIPCAWVNPECELIIGPGAVVDPELLARELNEIPEIKRVYVDGGAVLVDHAMGQAEKENGLGEAIGSTLEGVGVARTAKISRQGRPLARHLAVWHDRVEVTAPGETAWMARSVARTGGQVMLEGTQGSALSLHHGKWPFVTSADTNVLGILSDAGLGPFDIEHVFLVARTLPIRVGGNSGPMGDELEWEQVGVVPERTTVTNKIRRIARWNGEVFKEAAALNQPCGVFLMFADYLNPGIAGSSDSDVVLDSALPTEIGDLKALTSEIENTRHIPIIAYGTGGPRWALAYRGRCSHGVAWDAF